jgi:hypothetical protein
MPQGMGTYGKQRGRPPKDKKKDKKKKDKKKKKKNKKD